MNVFELLDQQLYLHRSISRSLENFKKIEKNNWTPAIICSRIASLKDNWTRMFSGHFALSKVAIAELRETTYFKNNVIDKAEEVYQTSLDYMSECLENMEPPVSQNCSMDTSISNAIPSSFSLLHLPPIKLPPFDGKYDEWEQFRDRFKSLIIDNQDLSNFAHMHFLSSCLKGRALDCVSNIAITGENFNAAWKALSSRFESKRRLLSTCISPHF